MEFGLLNLKMKWGNRKEELGFQVEMTKMFFFFWLTWQEIVMAYKETKNWGEC